MTGVVFCVAGTFRLRVPRGVAADDKGIDMARNWRPSDGAPLDPGHEITALTSLDVESSGGRDDKRGAQKERVGVGA